MGLFKEDQQKVLPFLFQSGQGQSIPVGCLSSALAEGPDVHLSSLSLDSESSEEDRTGVILITPVWPYQQWFTNLLQLSCGVFVQLLCQGEGRIFHPGPQSLHLAV